MNLIERHIFWRAAQLSLTTLAAATVIVLITQILIRVNVLTDSGQAISTFLKLALMLVPAMAVVVMPFALLTGASQTLSAMNSNSELSVLEAAGASQITTARPIFMLAVIMTLTTLGLSIFVEPWSNRQLRDIIAEAGADLVRFAVQSGSFKKIDTDLYIQIGEQLPGGAFGSIFIVDMRDKAAELLYYAKKGDIQDNDGSQLLVMEDGEIHRKNPATTEVSVIRFASYAIDFSQFGPASKATVYFPKERSLAFLLDPDPNDYFAKTRPDLLRSELHRRLSEWMFPLAFGLIATYFAGSARSNRQERAWGLVGAVGVAILFRAAGFVSANGSGKSLAYAVAAYLTPLSAILLFSTLIVTGRKLHIPQSLVDRTNALAAAVERYRVSFQLMLRGYRRERAGGDA
ncbi:MAG: LptF/LptG family permease [Mesorhizobium sp.]|nr:LptF/LptG family permease [Mesorhizobium sp.]